MKKPMKTKEEILSLVQGKTTAKVFLVGIRGYFMDTMGVPEKNDRGIYDDAFFWCSPNGFMAFNGNTDPSRFRAGKGFGSGKGMASLAPGVWLYKPGIHYGKIPHAAFRQHAPVKVMRDGVTGPYPDVGMFGINIHRGGLNGTSSLGCQTVPPAQWEAFKTFGYTQLKLHNQEILPYILIEN